MRLLNALLIVLVASASGFAATIHVPDNYPTIQGAISASANGDTILVRPGTYAENIDFGGKAITVASTSGPESTIIDGGKSGSVVTFATGEDYNSTLDGFTITNGSGTYFSPFAVYAGCGIYCHKASPRILNNIVTRNSFSGAVSVGGGIFTFESSPKIIGNSLIANSADYGGGISCLFLEPPLDILLDNNLIARNIAYGSGGGIDAAETTMTITNTTIVSNTASEYEGGGGIAVMDGTVDVCNCIVWNNSYYTGYEIALHSDISYAVMNISYSDVMNKKSSVFIDWDPYWSRFNEGPGMIDSDPQFSNAAGHDYHIGWNSPCRNTGDNSATTALVDFEGDERKAFGTIDMGADEFFPHLYMTGTPIPGAPVVVKIVGEPGEKLLLGLAGKVVDPPIPTAHGDLHLKLPLFAKWNLGLAPSDGIYEMPANIPAGWVSGSSYPFQALVGMWGVKATLTNLMLVTVK